MTAVCLRKTFFGVVIAIFTEIKKVSMKAKKLGKYLLN